MPLPPDGSAIPPHPPVSEAFASDVLPESAHALTTSIAAGDTAAFERFHRAWFDFALAEARRVCGRTRGRRDEQLSFDVVQDAMLRVIRFIRPMETEDDLRRWLRVVVRRCAYDLLRSEARRRRREKAASADAASPASGDGHEAAVRLAWLRHELKGLDADLAHLLGLRFQWDLTLDRIGRMLGLKAGAVDGRISRAVAGLRERSEERSDD